MLENISLGLVPIMVLIGIVYLINYVKKTLKNTISDEKIRELAQDIILDAVDDLTTDVEMQKRVYSLGVLIGNGAKSGFGLNKKSGKFSFEGLIQQGLGQLFSGGFNMGPQKTPQQPNGTKQPNKSNEKVKELF